MTEAIKCPYLPTDAANWANWHSMAQVGLIPGVEPEPVILKADKTGLKVPIKAVTSAALNGSEGWLNK